MAIIKIRKIRSREEDGAWVTSALVDGEEVWFSSPDARLAESPEAFMSAFLIPAQLRNDRLSCGRPVCNQWLANATALAEVTGKWWRRSLKPPVVEAITKPKGRRWFRKRALFFTGGVDSFHTLFRHPGKIHALVNVHGYDIALGNKDRQGVASASMRAVADAMDIPLVEIRTNLREHSYFRKNNWNFVHGGAIAAVAHLLGRQWDDFLLSSSTRKDDPRAWGSSWQIDPLWSSAATRFLGWGEHLSRAEKMEEIADQPIVKDHLRVCWSSRDAEPNCGVCPKCTRTMVSLAWCGKLDGLLPRFAVHPCLVEAVGTWRPAPIRSVDELDPVFMRPERLPAPLRDAMVALRDKMIARMEETLEKAG